MLVLAFVFVFIFIFVVVYPYPYPSLLDVATFNQIVALMLVLLLDEEAKEMKAVFIGSLVDRLAGQQLVK